MPARYSRTSRGYPRSDWPDTRCGAGLVQLADGGAHGDGLADADLASDHAQQRFGDAKAHAGDGFLMTRAVQEIFGRDVLGEGKFGEAEVCGPRCAHDD